MWKCLANLWSSNSSQTSPEQSNEYPSNLISKESKYSTIRSLKSIMVSHSILQLQYWQNKKIKICVQFLAQISGSLLDLTETDYYKLTGTDEPSLR